MITDSRKLLIFTLIFSALAFSACSSSEKKDDKTVVEQKREPSRAEKLGIKETSLQAFERASTELKKDKPDTQKAIDSLETSVEASPNFAEAQFNLGLLYLKVDEADKAVPPLEKAKELDPEYQEYSVALGRAYADKERYEESLKLFEEVVSREVAPDEDGNANLLTAKNNLAVLELRRGNTDIAIKQLQEILREDRDNVQALNTMGRVYHQAKNLSLAKYVFEEKALKVAPKNADIHNNLALVYLDLKLVPKAVEHLNLATEYDPNHYQAHLNLGVILLEYLDYQRALTQFTEAVRIVPANCQARLGLAASKFATANPDDAITEYNYYIDNCNSDHVSSHERLAKLYQSAKNDNRAALEQYKILIGIAKNEKKRKTYEAMAGFLESQLNQNNAAPNPEAAPSTNDDDTPEEDDTTAQHTFPKLHPIADGTNPFGPNPTTPQSAAPVDPFNEHSTSPFAATPNPSATTNPFETHPVAAPNPFQDQPDSKKEQESKTSPSTTPLKAPTKVPVIVPEQSPFSTHVDPFLNDTSATTRQK